MMDAIKLRKAIGLIATMEIAEPRRTLEYAVSHGDVDMSEGWVGAALGCVNEADMVETACEFLLADCREGYVEDTPDGSNLESTIDE